MKKKKNQEKKHIRRELVLTFQNNSLIWEVTDSQSLYCILVTHILSEGYQNLE